MQFKGPADLDLHRPGKRHTQGHEWISEALPRQAGLGFFTGDRADIDKVMYALNAYIPNKMYHCPLNLTRNLKDDKWLRIFGLTSTSEFMSEYKKVGGL